jgi:hypothetical protein
MSQTLRRIDVHGIIIITIIIVIVIVIGIGIVIVITILHGDWVVSASLALGSGHIWLFLYTILSGGVYIENIRCIPRL